MPIILPSFRGVVAPVSLPNPYGLWPFNGNATDYSGNGHNLSGSASFVSGLNGKQAASFSGSNYLYNTSLSVTNTPLTVSQWVYTTSTSGSFGFVSLGDGYSASSRLEGTVYNTETTSYYSLGGYADDLNNVLGPSCISTWRHIALVWDATPKQSIYVDGSLIGSRTSANDYQGTGWFRAGYAQVNGVYWPGLIQTLRIDKVALSDAQVAALYAAGA